MTSRKKKLYMLLSESDAIDVCGWTGIKPGCWCGHTIPCKSKSIIFADRKIAKRAIARSGGKLIFYTATLENTP